MQNLLGKSNTINVTVNIFVVVFNKKFVEKKKKTLCKKNISTGLMNAIQFSLLSLSKNNENNILQIVIWKFFFSF